jgi:hypothetical protein
MAKKKSTKRPKIIFMYEGDTEEEFYDLIFKAKLPKGSRLHFIHLCGFIKTNNKGVAHELYKYLINSNYLDEDCIHVFIAYDREGPVGTELNVNIELLRKSFSDEKRVKSINQIVATQDLESWLFLDIDGIYSFLRTKKSDRASHKYKSHQSFNNKHLSQLFQQNEKHYQKGEKVAGFITKLNLEKIYSNCSELKDGIELLISKCS